MERVISIGKQDFASLRENGYFYIDKTNFISEWWESGDDVTLITRPRRFGKTLNVSMLNCFFSTDYAGRADLFRGLSIWDCEKYRNIQGTYPTITLSFAGVKADNIDSAKTEIKTQIARLYRSREFLTDSGVLSRAEAEEYGQITKNMSDVDCAVSINILCEYLYRYYGRKVIVLLDEYDTPMQEAYIGGYCAEFTSFMRSLFNSTFKTNQYLERALMTGITRVSKESIFYDLNNLRVITTSSEKYADFFGFTQTEVFEALDEYGISGQRDIVKKWYDGFNFGSKKGIYNPWSIINFLKEKQIQAYWAATSSNSLINTLIQGSSAEIKSEMEILLEGKAITVHFDEQIVFNQLSRDENALWSLLVASGYLRIDSIEYRGELREIWYTLSITNLETRSMFASMFKGWFGTAFSSYNGFVRSLLSGNIKDMNAYMNDVALSTFSSFDTGTHPSDRSQPERFFHGFVLGLLVELRDIYEVKSNRESGYGRYDVMLIPKNNDDRYNAIVMEFKVLDLREEGTLENTARSALRQIEEKNYDAELIARGIERARIRHYGFAFEGKNVLIAE